MAGSAWLPLIDQNRCTGCAACIEACPTGALGRRSERAALVNPEKCNYCLACEDLCPTGAIQLPLLIGFAKPNRFCEAKAVFAHRRRE